MQDLPIQEIREALVAAGLSGPHQSHSRDNAISKLRACVSGDPEASFGISGLTQHTEQEALDALAGLTGCSDDLLDLAGADTIDPELTIGGIIAAATRLREEAHRGATLLACTGHPTGVLEMYIRILDAYRAAGGKPVRLGEDVPFEIRRGKREEIRYVGGIGCLADWGNLKHTHASYAMEHLLDSYPTPDVVLGDHGFAGAAIERGIPTIAVMDINDPALALAWAAGRDVTIVPLDDNRSPFLYEPVWALFGRVLSE